MKKFLTFVAAVCMFGELMFFGWRTEQFVQTGDMTYAWIMLSCVFFAFLNLITIELCNDD